MGNQELEEVFVAAIRPKNTVSLTSKEYRAKAYEVQSNLWFSDGFSHLQLYYLINDNNNRIYQKDWPSLWCTFKNKSVH